MPLAVEIDVPAGAAYLRQKIDDLEGALQENHTGKMFDASKGLLETVFRTIIIDHNGQVASQNGREPSFMNLYKQSLSCIGNLSNENGVAFKLNELCTKAIDVIGNLRNNFGYASHGQDGYTRFDINPIEAVFISNVAAALVNFLYGAHTIQPLSYQNVRLIYGNFETFNDYIDDLNSEVVVSGISMRPSEALFMTDQSAYRELLIEYTESGVAEIAPEYEEIE